MSGIDFSELISDSIFKNSNLTKPEIPDSNISDNPNAHPYSSPPTSLRSMDTLLTLLSIFWMKEWRGRVEKEEESRRRRKKKKRVMSPLYMCARFATARKRCSSFGDKPGFALIFFPHAVWILLLKASEFSCLQKQEPGSLTKFAMQKCTCQKKFDTYLVGIQKVAHHLKLPTFW